MYSLELQSVKNAVSIEVFFKKIFRKKLTDAIIDIDLSNVELFGDSRSGLQTSQERR